MKGSSYFLIIIMLATLGVIVASMRMSYFTAKLLPILISGVVFLLAAIGLLREIRWGNRQAANAPEAATAGPKIRLSSYLPITAWIVGVSLGVYVFGFLVALPIFLLAYMRIQQVRWRTNIICTVMTVGIIYCVFEILLKSELYRGMIFGA